jgi:hypothetical protein
MNPVHTLTPYISKNTILIIIIIIIIITLIKIQAIIKSEKRKIYTFTEIANSILMIARTMASMNITTRNNINL